MRRREGATRGRGPASPSLRWPRGPRGLPAPRCEISASGCGGHWMTTSWPQRSRQWCRTLSVTRVFPVQCLVMLTPERTMATFWTPPSFFMLFLARGPKRISRKLLPWLLSRDWRKLAVSSTGGRRAGKVCWSFSFPFECLYSSLIFMMFTCSAEKLVLIVTISTVICSVTEVLAGGKRGFNYRSDDSHLTWMEMHFPSWGQRNGSKDGQDASAISKCKQLWE